MRVFATALVPSLLALASGAALADPVTKTTTVKAQATVQLVAHDGDVLVKVGGKGTVKLEADADQVDQVTLTGSGDKVTATAGPGVDGVVLTVPAGTKLVLASISGDIKVGPTGGDVKVRATSGDVVIDSAHAVDVVSVSGDVRITRASGPVRMRTVSGDASVDASAAQSPALEFESTSGDLHWAGVCGKGCALALRTLSGDLTLKLGKTSSFALELESFSGELRDHLGLTIDKQTPSGHDMEGGAGTEAHFGKGEGAIRASVFSGDLVLDK